VREKSEMFLMVNRNEKKDKERKERQDIKEGSVR